MPDTACLWITGIDCIEDKNRIINFWDNIYGYNMSALGDQSKKTSHRLALNPEQLMTNSCLVKEIDLLTVSRENIDICSLFQLEVKKKGFVRGISLHFNVEFNYGLERVVYSICASTPKPVGM